MNKLYFNSGKMDDKVNGVKSKANDAIDDLDSIYKNRYKINVSVFNKTSYYSDIGTAYTKGTAVCQAAINLMITIDGAAEKYEQCEKELKKDFDEFDLLSCGYENLVRDYLGMDSINTVDGQRLENACKIVIGTCAVVVGVAVVAYAAPAALTNIVIHTAVKVTVSTAVPTIQAAINGENVYDTFADSFMDAGINSMIDNIFSTDTIGGFIGTDLSKLEGLNKYTAKGILTFGKVIEKDIYKAARGKDVNLLSDLGGAAIDIGISYVFDSSLPELKRENFQTTSGYFGESLKRNVAKYLTQTYTKVHVKTTFTVAYKSLKGEKIDFKDTAWSTVWNTGQGTFDTFLDTAIEAFFPKNNNNK